MITALSRRASLGLRPTACQEFRMVFMLSRAFNVALVSILLPLSFVSQAAGQSALAPNADFFLNLTQASPSDQPQARSDPPTQVQKPNSEKFDWGAAIRQSLLFTGVMHAFRFSTEPGTRDAMNGPWFRDWMKSVAAIRGWTDGDPFITDDIGHPIEGA